MQKNTPATECNAPTRVIASKINSTIEVIGVVAILAG
jgi:hypothetical protein